MILPPENMNPTAGASVVVLGAGACGLTAALAAHSSGTDVIAIERDRSPSGSTALSSGFIPAAGTQAQAAQSINDTPELLVQDILRKSYQTADPQEALRVATVVGPALDWLTNTHGIPFHVLDTFLYPGHSRHRMHAVPERTGAALMARLLAAAETQALPLLTEAQATHLFATPAGIIRGLRIERPDQTTEDIECGALILACNGFGGDPTLLAQHIPEIAQAIYFGHAGNQGHALRWGQALGADPRDLTSYQGHGNVAHPHGILITWALLMEGGIQINQHAQRFSNEHDGYSEQAVRVLQQPGQTAWTLYDARLHHLGQTFEDYRTAEAAGAIRTAPTPEALAALINLPPEPLAQTLAQTRHLAQTQSTDQFGRHFTNPPLSPPYYAVRVTGTLFHTQGGLRVDPQARVLRPNDKPFPNLLAGGGAARGVSGNTVEGYLSGNGLLTAIAYGRLAGQAAPTLVI